MKMIMKIKNLINIFITLLIIVLIQQAEESSAEECTKKNSIETCTTSVVLSNRIKAWGKDNLNCACNFFIGKQYYIIFIKNKSNKSTLEKANEYLTKASTCLSKIYDRYNYNECYLLLLKRQCYQSSFNLKKIVELRNKIHDVNIFEDVIIRSYLTNYLNIYVNSHLKNNLLQDLPQNVQILVEESGIDYKSKRQKRIKEMKDNYDHLMEQYEANLLTLQKSPSSERIETQIQILHSLKPYSKFGIPDSLNAFDSWKQYFSQFEYESISSASDEYLCHHYEQILQHLQKAKNSLPKLDIKDTLNVACHKKLACISDTIQSSINNTKLKMNENEWEDKLNIFENFVKDDSGITFSCQGASSSYDQEAKWISLINKIKLFLKSVPPPGKNFKHNLYTRYYKLLIQTETNCNSPDIKQILTYLSHVRNIKLDDSTISVLTPVLETKISPYLTDFIVLEYPEETVQLINKIGYKKDLLKKLKRIKSFKDAYASSFEAIRQPHNQTISNIREIISLFDQDGKDMANIPKDNYQMWEKYFVALENADNHSMIQNKCYSYKDAFNQIKKVKQMFAFATDINNAKCKSQFACLSSSIQKESYRIIPIKNENKLSEKHSICQSWINQYTMLLNNCKKDLIIDDQRPFLKETNNFYNTYELFTQKKKNVKSLIQFFSNAKNKQLKAISGYYIAQYFHDNLIMQLKKGPENNLPINVIDRMANELETYKRYADYFENAENEFNIQEQLNYLSSFFHKTESAALKDIFPKIDSKIKGAWNIKKPDDKQEETKPEKTKPIKKTKERTSKTKVKNLSSNLKKRISIESPDDARIQLSNYLKINGNIICKNNFTHILELLYSLHTTYTNSTYSKQKEYKSILLHFLSMDTCLTPADKANFYQLFTISNDKRTKE